MILNARKRTQRGAYFALAALLLVSSVTAGVPFLFSQKANAEASYNVRVTPKCVNGLVHFDIKGDNPAPAGTAPVYVKSSADFKMSSPVIAEAGAKDVSVPLDDDKASVPASAATIYVSSNGVNGDYQWLNDGTAIAPYAAFNCYDTVYVAPNGNDNNQGTTAATPFLTIQKALDTVNENGTVNVANGEYHGTAVYKKSGTKLIGQSKQTVLFAESSSGQAGVFANEVNDVALQNFTVRPGASLTAGSIVKFTNGTNGQITNVDAKASNMAKLTGIDINSFANATLNNVYVNGVGKDGVSVTSKSAATSEYASNNVTMNNVSVADSAWSGFAFYTVGGNNAAGENLTGVKLNNIKAQYNARGIYFEGTTGKTVTGVNGIPVALNTASLKNSTQFYITNGQTASVDATATTFGNSTKVGNQMTGAEEYALNGLIYDFADNSQLGRVVYDAVAPVIASVKLANGTPLEGAYLKGVQTVTANVTDNGIVGNAPSFTNFELRKDGTFKDQWAGQPAASATPSVTIDTSKYADGDYTLRVYGRDQAGTAFEGFYSFAIDRTAPVISASSDADTTVYGTKTFTINQTELNPSSLYVEYDQMGSNGKWQKKQGQQFDNTNTASLVVDTTKWNDGLYQIKVSSKDKAGNSTGYSFTVTADNSGPEITDNGFSQNGNVFTPDFVVGNDTKSVTWTADSTNPEDGVSYDNELLNPDFVVTKDGTYKFTLTVYDEYGNDSTRNLEFAYKTPAQTGEGVTDPVAPAAVLAPAVVTAPATIPTPAFTGVIGATASNAAQAAVLGATTDSPSSDTGVKGTTDDKTASIVNSDANQGRMFGLAWYWWLLIIAAAAAAVWWIIAGARRRNEA